MQTQQEQRYMDSSVSYWQLFKECFYISAFTFGGGYVMVPLMRNRFVQGLGWLDEEEILNLFAIAQSAPGVLAINASIMIGYRLKGFLGALTTILATVLPPLCIITVLSYFYLAFRANRWVAALLLGMQAGVAAVILDVVIRMLEQLWKQKKIQSIALFMAAFVAMVIFHVDLVYILLVAASIGAIKAYKKEKTE